MTTETIDKATLFREIDEAAGGLQKLMASLEVSKVNAVPYQDSWTAAQLFDHVTQSVRGMSNAMNTAFKPAGRNQGERIDDLKKIFLDFSTKFKSPDFILPGDGPYEKVVVTEDLKKSFSQLKEYADKTDLTGLVEGIPFGPVTKLEILHFVLYHTQRHLHQMQRICEALNN